MSVEKKQAVWRSRRGLLELDLYLMPFVNGYYDHLDIESKARYREILEYEDPEILTWLKNPIEAPPQYRYVLARVIEFARAKSPRLDEMTCGSDCFP